MSPRPTAPQKDRRSLSPATLGGPSKRENACLEFAFDQLDPTDAVMLIKVIARVVELERSHGEEVALAMLHRAMAYEGEGRQLH